MLQIVTYTMKHCYFLFMAVLLFSSCQRENDFFAGKLETFSLEGSNKGTVDADTIPIDIPFYPTFSVIDSLVFFYSPSAMDYSFTVYDIKNKCLIGKYCPRGRGHEEYVTHLPITRFFCETEDLKTLLVASGERRMMIWNISESLREKKTIYENVAPFYREEGLPGPSYVYRLSEDTILSYTGCFRKPSSNELSPQTYQLRTYSTDKEIRSYYIHKNTINNKESNLLPENFLIGDKAVKPDGSKMVEAMRYLPQINIINFRNGRISGFREETGPDYSIFKTDMKNPTLFYHRVCANDSFVFALWAGPEEGSKCSILHVFDWDGHLIKVVKLSTHIHELFLDEKNELLYGLRANGTNLYRFCLSDMGLQKRFD